MAVSGSKNLHHYRYRVITHFAAIKSSGLKAWLINTHTQHDAGRERERECRARNRAVLMISIYVAATHLIPRFSWMERARHRRCFFFFAATATPIISSLTSTHTIK